MVNELTRGLNTVVPSSPVTFLSGFFFSMSTAKTSVLYLQNVFQADACHVSFGFYTIYTAYGISANCNTFLLGFAIIFGNETKESWELYLRFLKTTHPSLDNAMSTFITDQGKGLIAGVQSSLPLVGHFHCTWHRRKNIMKMLRGGSKKYSGMWLYNQCMLAKTTAQLDKVKHDNAMTVSDKSLRYINSIPDTAQFPAARVAMGNDVTGKIYMYQRTSSQAAESMNNANMRARERTATDVLCSAHLLIEMSCKRFNRHMELAWKWNEFLTPHGKKLRDECLKNIDFREYTIKITEADTKWNCSVSYRNKPEQLCFFFVEEIPSCASLFGGCECRAPEVDGVPCHHMIAVVKSGKIKGLNENNAMPEWWTTAVWRKQYPKNSGALCDFEISTLKNNHTAATNLRYCPDKAVGNKSGRPKSNKRRKSFLEENKKKISKKSSDSSV